MIVAVINSLFAPTLAGRLPEWLDARWFHDADELDALAAGAQVGWFDGIEPAAVNHAVRLAVKLKWLNTVAAGVDPFPLDLLRERGVILTNGAGLNALPIAEYIVMGMLVIAKGYRTVVRAQDRHEWLTEPPGRIELAGSRALVIGAGGIGGRTAKLLRPWGVEVVEARRSPAPGVLGGDEWRARLGEVDWVIVTVPSTPETDKLIGAAELAAMRPGASLLNFARGAVVDQDALLAALRRRTIAAAFLDVTDPEPLPADHPLWREENCHISMHLSGRSQDKLMARGAERFLANLVRYRRGEPLDHRVDLTRGY